MNRLSPWRWRLARTRRGFVYSVYAALTFCAAWSVACAAANAQPSASPAGASSISFEEALRRARQYAGQLQSANLAVLLAKEDTAQVRAGRLPSVNAFNQYIYTEGNGTPSGVFVANDGVHVYNEQAVVHEELLSLLRRGELNRALAAEAVAHAKADIASRGLTATVLQDFYAIVAAERKLANANLSLKQAQQFADITGKQEAGGEVAHADVVKARIDLAQRERDLREGQLAVEKAKISLGILIFPDFSSSFSVVDDLEPPALLPPAPEVEAQATATSPEVHAAAASVQQASQDVTVARYQYLPSFGLDFFYGLDANQFAARTYSPDLALDHPNYRQNLGYVAQATLNIPIWNWGATHSKVKQAEFKREQALLDQSLAQRTLHANLASAYAEARLALAELDSLRNSVALAAESLRLTLLRYQAGEATALEVVDAQNTANLARNAQDDGLARYRIALAGLQILTGSL
jgi:outer membrane protein TolC